MSHAYVPGVILLHDGDPVRNPVTDPTHVGEKRIMVTPLDTEGEALAHLAGWWVHPFANVFVCTCGELLLWVGRFPPASRGTAVTARGMGHIGCQPHEGGASDLIYPLPATPQHNIGGVIGYALGKLHTAAAERAERCEALCLLADRKPCDSCGVPADHLETRKNRAHGHVRAYFWCCTCLPVGAMSAYCHATVPCNR